MSLEQLTKQLAQQSAQKSSSSSSTKQSNMPPVELWDPPYCGEIDIRITRDGTWLYNGTGFKRLSLVKLFASVLKKEGDDYFLVTPVEKVKIVVEDAPLLLTQWQWQEHSQQTMEVTTSVDDVFSLDEHHPLTVNEQGELYITVRRNLLAKVHRNIYYQWIELATEQKTKNGIELVFTSHGCQFSLGCID
jgi:hypothetical protein